MNSKNCILCALWQNWHNLSSHFPALRTIGKFHLEDVVKCDEFSYFQDLQTFSLKEFYDYFKHEIIENFGNHPSHSSSLTQELGSKNCNEKLYLWTLVI